MGKVQKLRKRAGRVNIFVFALLAFVLPLSTSAISVLAILFFLLWLVEGRFVDKLREVFSNPVAIAVLGYLFVFGLGLIWSPDVRSGFEVLQERWKLALLPVFLTTISYRHRSLYINSFLAGLTVAMLMTFLAWLGLLHYGDVTTEHLTRKTFHVVYNPMLAFGIYLVLHDAVWGRRTAGIRAGLFGLAAIMTFNMFITEGRTGQLVFFVLMGLLLFQVFNRNRLKALLIVSVLLPLMFTAGYRLSHVFKQRVDMACQEVRQFHENPDTSVGMRLLFWRNSWEIIQQHPWLGVGTGGFASAYAEINRKRSSGSIATDNPHNQYVLAAVMAGIPGVLALLSIFAALFKQAAVLEDDWKRVRFAFPIFYLVIMFFATYLTIFETGFLFSSFTAILYANDNCEINNNSKLVR